VKGDGTEKKQNISGHLASLLWAMVGMDIRWIHYAQTFPFFSPICLLLLELIINYSSPKWGWENLWVNPCVMVAWAKALYALPPRKLRSYFMAANRGLSTNQNQGTLFFLLWGLFQFPLIILKLQSLFCQALPPSVHSFMSEVL
jgi:hypothetical protein